MRTFPMPLSFCGVGSLSGELSSCTPIEWPFMPACAAARCVWLSNKHAASIPRPAISRENKAARGTNAAMMSSCTQYNLSRISDVPLSCASYASPSMDSMYLRTAQYSATSRVSNGSFFGRYCDFRCSFILYFFDFGLARWKRRKRLDRFRLTQRAKSS